MVGCQRDIGANKKSSKWQKLEQFEHIVLAYNPKCEVNTMILYWWTKMISGLERTDTSMQKDAKYHL